MSESSHCLQETVQGPTKHHEVKHPLTIYLRIIRPNNLKSEPNNSAEYSIGTYSAILSLTYTKSCR